MSNFNKIKASLFSPFFKKNETIQEKINFISDNIIIAKDTKYYDFMASALAFNPIEKRINNILGFYANTHSNATHANFIEELYNLSKQKIRNILGLNEDFCIIANMPNSTSAIKRAQEILGVYTTPTLKKNLKLKEIGICLNSQIEHHSNDISWRESLLKCIQVPLDKKLNFDLKLLEKIISENPSNGLKIGAFNVASNVTGLMLPIEEISKILVANNFIRFFDMSASASHLKVDSKFYDFAVFASHKFLGGINSSSFLVFRKKFYDNSLSPSFAGGGVVEYSNSTNYQFFKDIEKREEAGSINALALIKTALCLMLMEEISFEYISLREKTLREVLIYELKKIPAIDIYGESLSNTTLSIALNVSGISPYSLAIILSKEFGLQVRAGCSCAGSYGHALLSIDAKEYSDLTFKPGWLRISPHFSASISEMVHIAECVKKSVELLRNG